MKSSIFIIYKSNFLKINLSFTTALKHLELQANLFRFSKHAKQISIKKTPDDTVVIIR
jgi:hypothetical protein